MLVYLLITHWLYLRSVSGISKFEHVEHASKAIAVTVDGASHSRRLADARNDGSATSLEFSDYARPRMMRRQPMEDSGSPDSSIFSISVQRTMKYNTSGRFVCADEGRDCCCKGEVRLGKKNNGSMDQWTSWKDSELWATCSTDALGDLYGDSNGRYCECNGRCPLTCKPPLEITSTVANIHHTTPCAEDSEVYIPGHPCTLQCMDGFQPTFRSLTCMTDRSAVGNYAWSPNTFECVGLPCAAPTWVENAADPPCHQGLHIVHGGSCGPMCKPGYEPSETHLYCSKGSLSPMGFHCRAASCGVSGGWIENENEDGACKEGQVVKSDHNCTAQCKQGYRPSLEHLSCRYGEFYPAAFICQEAPCAVPVGVSNSNDTFPCSELWSPLTSSSIPSGQVCSPQCKSGFAPDIKAINCSMGVLSPPVFTCVELPCQAPNNITHAAGEVCKEGSSIGHDFACTAQCSEGYEPSVASLDCVQGQLSPATFTCIPASCEVPNVQHAPQLSCRDRPEGRIPHKEYCHPVCDAGWETSDSSLQCWAGKLSPENFTCTEKSCSAPGSVEHSLGCSHNAGASISHGGTCTPTCAEGYEPSVASLVCVRGGLQPESFSCIPKPCTLPTDVLHGSCSLPVGHDSGHPGLLTSGFNCTPQCSDDKFPSEHILSCNAGALSPPTFSCGQAQKCYPEQSMFLHSAVSPCWEGDEIDHGKDCHVQCISGYTPSVHVLSCHNGQLMHNGQPYQVDCEANDGQGVTARCLAPVGVAHQQLYPCKHDRVSFTEGQECEVSCADGYTPNVNKLTCRSGAFDPPTFQCHQD